MFSHDNHTAVPRRKRKLYEARGDHENLRQDFYISKRRVPIVQRMPETIPLKTNATWPLPPRPDSNTPIHIPSDDDLYRCSDSGKTTLPPPKKLRSDRIPASEAIDTNDHIVSITVGTAPDCRIFRIHASLLSKSSEYMETKSKPEWMKGSATVDLSHKDANAFNIYVNWLYQSRLLLPAKKGPNSEWRSLARPLALDEELIDLAFKNAVMEALSAAAREEQVDDILPFLVELALIIYDAIPEDGPGRKFLVEVGKSLEREQLNKVADELPYEYVPDLLVALGKDDTPARVGGKRKHQLITISSHVDLYHRHSEQSAALPVKNTYASLDEEIGSL